MSGSYAYRCEVDLGVVETRAWMLERTWDDLPEDDAVEQVRAKHTRVGASGKP
jgi:hypothetical protein